MTNLPSPTVTAIGIFSEPAVVWENRWVVTVGWGEALGVKGQLLRRSQGTSVRKGGRHGSSIT